MWFIKRWKRIIKYKKIKIEVLNKLNKEKKNNNFEIIENKNINLCDINLNKIKIDIKI